MDRAEAVREESGYEAAREQLDLALERAEGFEQGDPRLADTLKALGDLEYRYQDYELAEPFYERALALRLENLESHDLKIRDSHEDLAELYFSDGRYQEALGHFESMLKVAGDALGANHNDVAYAWTRIGWTHYHLDENEDAEKVFQQAIDLRQEAGADAGNLAGFYQEQGEYFVGADEPGRATESYRRALDLWGSVWGEADARFIEKLVAMGEEHGANGQYDEQEGLLNRALEIRERVQGAESVETAAVLSELGAFWFNRGDDERAGDFYRRALQIREGVEEWELHVSDDRVRYANVLAGQERYEEAIEHMSRGLEIRAANFEPSDELVTYPRRRLAELRSAVKDYHRAAADYRELLAIYQGKDPKSDEVVANLQALGEMDSAAERYEDAINSYERAAAILEERPEPNRELADALVKLSEAYSKAGRESDAIDAQNRATGIYAAVAVEEITPGLGRWWEEKFGAKGWWIVGAVVFALTLFALGVACVFTFAGSKLTRTILRQYEPPPGAPVEPVATDQPRTPPLIILPGEAAPRMAQAPDAASTRAVWAAPAHPEAIPLIEPPLTRRFSFHGEGGSLFGIHIVNMLLALLTLGIYYFWGKVKALKYVYSQAEFDDDRFAFHGTGKELFLGWLRAFPVILLLYFFPQLLGLIWASEMAQIVGALVLVAGIFVIIPIAQIGSWRYRLSRTSWRGIRFSFRGRTKRYLGLYLKGLLFTILSLGMYSPVMMIELLRYQYGNTYFGNTKFRFHARAVEIFPAFIVSWLLTLVTLGIHGFWYQAELARYLWSHTTFATSRMRCRVTGGGLLWLTLGNALLVLFTLGLAFPWVEVRTARYWLENVYLEGDLDLAAVQQDAQQVSAAAEGMADFLDLPIGF